jgi:pyruvate formate lyase activating enzyme
MTGPAHTSPAMLLRAATIARRAGLRYVYAGNKPGRAGDLEHTACASCGERLIGRSGYFIQQYRLTPDGGCPHCNAKIPGIWSPSFERQRTALPFLPHDRTRLSVI